MDNKELSLPEFLQNLQTLSSLEEKLRSALHYMRNCLDQEKNPNFKGFWEIRKEILLLFKEPLNPLLRQQMWLEYMEMTKEGRRLKELIDEETVFFAEQIDIAITALARDIESFQKGDENLLLHMAPPQLSEVSILKPKLDHFKQRQLQISWLNTAAMRIQALRQEIANRDMRVKLKASFFNKLSQLGDCVFPKKREIVTQVSQDFVDSVKDFVALNFSADQRTEKLKKHLFPLREEIKSLQTVAKQLFLNPEAFTATRQMLSECWDHLKMVEKEVKKEFAHEKQKSQENVAQVKERLNQISDALQNEGDLQKSEYALNEIVKWMRSIELVGSDVWALKEAIGQLRTQIETQRAKKENEEREKKEEQDQRKKQELAQWQNKMKELGLRIATEPIEQLESDLKSHREEIDSLPISKREKQQLERMAKEVRDLIEERKEREMLSLSDDDKVALSHLLELVQQKKDRRAEIKAQIEEYRKILGATSLNFEKAIEYNELMQQQRDRLDKMDEAINLLEIKIYAIKRSKILQ